MFFAAESYVDALRRWIDAHKRRWCWEAHAKAEVIARVAMRHNWYVDSQSTDCVWLRHPATDCAVLIGVIAGRVAVLSV